MDFSTDEESTWLSYLMTCPFQQANKYENTCTSVDISIPNPSSARPTPLEADREEMSAVWSLCLKHTLRKISRRPRGTLGRGQRHVCEKTLVL